MSETQETRRADSPQLGTARDFPAAAGVEGQSPETDCDVSAIRIITSRSKREDLLNRGSMGLRGLALIFSLLAFIVMASNQHGDWGNFDNYEEFRYVLAIAIISTVYTLGQALRYVHEVSTNKHLSLQRTSASIDFFGDQIVAYFLISSASSAVPMTNRMREGSDNLFTDTVAASITMQFLAFVTLALSALISGYKLSRQSFI